MSTTMEERRAAAMALDFSTDDADEGETTDAPDLKTIAASLNEDDGDDEIELPGDEAEAPAAKPVVERRIPKLSDVEERVRKQHEARVERERASEDAHLASEYRRLKAEGKLDAQQVAQLTPQTVTQLYRSLGPAERKELLNSLVKEVQNPDVAATERTLRAEIEQLKTKIVDPDKIVEKTREQLTADAAQAKLEADFHAVAGDSERFPHVAGLPEPNRLALAYEVIGLYREYDKANGTRTPLDDEQIANEMEELLASRAQGTPPPAPAVSKKSAATAGRSEAGGAAAGTLNDLAGSAPTVKPRTMADKRALAIQLAKTWG